jgi:site-specific DNA-methyltransferase (adenine-specific)
MKIENVRVGEIKPYKRNAKRHPPEQVEYIANSIREFGWQQPLVIDKNGVVVIGHGRLLAAKKLGMKEVPCVRAEGLTDEQIKALRLADNKTNESEWDIKLLAEDMGGIFDIDMSQFGFETLLDEDEPAEVVEDDVPEEAPTRAKLGDIWQLGEHRLMCGDSTDAETVAKLMDGAKADMVFTDSPYGINAVGDNGEVGADFGIAKKGKYKKIIADDTTETAQQAYDIYSQLCDKMILWGGNYFLDFLPASDGWLIWDKRGESGIRNTFAGGEMAWCSFHTPVRIYHQLWNGMIREGEHEKRVHPTQKPIRMLSEILQDFTNEGDIILDVFGGSGSTLIACEQTGRTCYMAELSPEYVDVIIARYEKLTGNKAVLIMV